MTNLMRARLINAAIGVGVFIFASMALTAWVSAMYIALHFIAKYW